MILNFPSHFISKTISLDDFKIWKKLGRGSIQFEYYFYNGNIPISFISSQATALVQKKGGSDNGQFYALKASNIEEEKTWKTDINIERVLIDTIKSKKNWYTFLVTFTFRYLENVSIASLLFCENLGCPGTFQKYHYGPASISFAPPSRLPSLVIYLSLFHAF